MRKLGLLGFAVGIALLGLARVAAATGGDPYLYQALIDIDSNNATGCEVAAKDDNFAGPVEGIEWVLTARVFRFTMNANVVDLQLQSCDGTMLTAPATINNGDWPVGLNVGVNGADVVEFFVARVELGDPESMTVSFHASIGLPANDVLLTTNGETSGDPIFFSLTGQAAPAVSWLGLALCAAILLFAAFSLQRRNRNAAAVVVAVIAVATTVMTAWAVTIMADGNVADWTVPAAATDVLNDSTANDPGEDIVAAFITADAENVYFRMDQKNLAPCGVPSQPCCVNPGGAFCAMGACEGAANAGGGMCVL